MNPAVLNAAGEGFVAPSTADFWQPLFGTGAFAVTRTMLLVVVIGLVLAVVFVRSTRKLAVVPSKGQYVLETSYGFVRNSIARDLIGEDNMRPYLPLLFATFTFIFLGNVSGIIPVIQFPATARIGIPIAPMLFVYVVYLAIGFRRRGFLGYIKNLCPPGVPIGAQFLVYPLEAITYFITRPFTLALRLFGNMFAGHLLLLLIAVGSEHLLHLGLEGNIGLGLIGIPVWLSSFVFTVFELLIEFLQAYVFTILAAFYIADSLSDEH